MNSFETITNNRLSSLKKLRRLMALKKELKEWKIHAICVKFEFFSHLYYQLIELYILKTEKNPLHIHYFKNIKYNRQIINTVLIILLFSNLIKVYIYCISNPISVCKVLNFNKGKTLLKLLSNILKIYLFLRTNFIYKNIFFSNQN